ncbi:hypothetical protein CCACVL1_14875 [Corchorus capsularis]|uniref:Uncharacterized protein n=1 Tax=Corchorus capsularis TaxID=210143 RepID=A0A1R3I531_COCAP|nr:hypothetical protein CCACVL1_14875 [Corchorus capsularis]
MANLFDVDTAASRPLALAADLYAAF